MTYAPHVVCVVPLPAKELVGFLRAVQSKGLAVLRPDCVASSLAVQLERCVDQQVITVTGSGATLAPPKTPSSVRTVPLPDLVMAELEAHVASFGDNEWMFRTHSGGLIRRGYFSELWRPAVARAGVPDGTTFHDLRHTYASMLIRSGESVKVVQSRLGHKSAQETMDTYAHLWPDSDGETRRAIDQMLAPAAGRLAPAVVGA